MKNIRIGWKLSFGFGIIILLMISGGLYSGNTASNLAETTNKMYRHPMAVGTSIRDINLDLVAVHRSMKDVAMAKNMDQLKKAQAVADSYSEKSSASFKILNERFLGDKTDIKEAKQLFEEWTPIRQKVIEQTKILINNDASAITKGEGAQHIGKIIRAIDELIIFAQGKAQEFNKNALSADAKMAAGLVNKFFKHPFTVSTTAMELKVDILTIVRDMKDIATAKTISEVETLANNVDESETEMKEDFAVIHERFLGDQSLVNKAEALFLSWKEIRDKVIAMRKLQLSANPGEITREEGAPHLAKLTAVLDKIKLFADNKGVVFNDNAKKQASDANTYIFIIFAFAAILGIIISIIITRSITLPLKKGTTLAQAVAIGDLDVALEIDQKDEIGVLAAAMQEMMTTLKVKANLVDKVSQGDFSVIVDLASDKDLLGKSLQLMVKNLNELLNQISYGSTDLGESSASLSTISDQISSATVEMASQADTVSGASTQMTSSIAANASSSEEMSANIQSISATSTEMSQNMIEMSETMENLSASIKNVSDKSSNAYSITEEAIKSSQSATLTINELSEAASKIGEITEVIKEIAQQTNLLALNANIEAASAGEAGKGFAVVANEIKDLAKQSSTSAESIAKTVTDIQEKTNASQQSISDISQIISNISASSEEIDKIAIDSSSSVNSVVQNVKESASGVNDIAKLINEISTVAQDTAKTSGELHNGSDEITKNMIGLSTVVTQTSEGINQVNQKAKGLFDLAEKQREMVGKFKLKNIG